MKKISKYIDEVTGQEFDNETEAQSSEDRNSSIEQTFSFWKHIPEEGGCEFTNGGWCYQRTQSEFEQLLDTIARVTTNKEPWIAKHYDKVGGLTREYVQGHSMIGRFLGDNEPRTTEIYKYWCIQGNICPKCYREYGQMFYAIHCKHDNSIPTKTLKL